LPLQHVEKSNLVVRRRAIENDVPAVLLSEEGDLCAVDAKPIVATPWNRLGCESSRCQDPLETFGLK